MRSLCRILDGCTILALLWGGLLGCAVLGGNLGAVAAAVVGWGVTIALGEHLARESKRWLALQGYGPTGRPTGG